MKAQQINNPANIRVHTVPQHLVENKLSSIHELSTSSHLLPFKEPIPRQLQKIANHLFPPPKTDLPEYDTTAFHQVPAEKQEKRIHPIDHEALAKDVADQIPKEMRRFDVHKFDHPLRRWISNEV